MSNLACIKYDNAMYTTSVPVEEYEADYVDEDVEEPVDYIDTSFIEEEDEEIAYLIKHFTKSGKL